MFEAVDTSIVNIGEMFGQMFTYIGAMFGANGTVMDNTATFAIVNYGVMFAVCILGSSDMFKNAAEYIRKKAPEWVQYGFPVAQTAVMLASIAYITTSSYNPFLYFNF